MELPADLAGYGEERLGKLEVGDLRSECARRGLDVKPQAQKNTCIKLLLEWKAAQGGPKAQGLPFDLAHYGKERLEKLDVAVLRTECGLRGIDVKVLAQTSTCVAELLKWKAARGGACLGELTERAARARFAQASAWPGAQTSESPTSSHRRTKRCGVNESA